MPSNRAHASGRKSFSLSAEDFFMPDPVKAKAKIVAGLDDRHYALLGRTVASWARAEARLAFTVAWFSQAKLRSVMFLFENMTTRARLASAAAVVADDVATVSRAKQDEIMVIIQELRGLAPYRHIAAHGNWLGLTQRGAMVCVYVHESRGSNVQLRSYQLREFESAISRLDHLTASLKELSESYGRTYSEAAFDFTENGEDEWPMERDADVDFT